MSTAASGLHGYSAPAAHGMHMGASPQPEASASLPSKRVSAQRPGRRREYSHSPTSPARSWARLTRKRTGRERALRAARSACERAGHAYHDRASRAAGLDSRADGPPGPARLARGARPPSRARHRGHRGHRGHQASRAPSDGPAARHGSRHVDRAVPSKPRAVRRPAAPSRAAGRRGRRPRPPTRWSATPAPRAVARRGARLERLIPVKSVVRIHRPR